jgi:hypothetical protein
MEEWKYILGYGERYKISSLGRMASLARKDSMGRDVNERILSQNIAHGYFYVDLCLEGDRKRYFIHRLVAQYFVKNPLNKPEVNHIDGNKQNDCMQNLEWVTSSENKLHSYRIGLQKRRPGIKHPLAKLNDDSIREIRKSNLSNDELGEKYGVTRGTIWAAKNGKTWLHVK